MAINIFSGTSGKRSPGVNRSKGRVAQNVARSAAKLVDTVKGKAATSKVANIVGKVGSIAEKYGSLIPGVGGIVSKVGGLLSRNDPEWWMNVPGTGISTNQPLSPMDEQVEGVSGLKFTGFINRGGILEFTTMQSSQSDVEFNVNSIPAVIAPTSSMITTYLMQNVRKVVNAVPLQSPDSYRAVFQVQATAYALKHQLDKLIKMTTHSMPYLPSFTDGSYDILAAGSYSQLVGMRDRLAEYCKASVRLPHTLCQYLAWRYGRVYKARRTGKSSLVIYNVLPISLSLADYQKVVNLILGFVANTENPIYDESYTVTPTEKQAAQSDLFNAYQHHIMDVEIREDTQFIYDPKEFVLRTNLDVIGNTENLLWAWQESSSTEPVLVTSPARAIRPDPEIIYMDSELDNKTTFMASTVSTNGSASTLSVPLFPVRAAIAHYAGRIKRGNIQSQPSCVVAKDGKTYSSLFRDTRGTWSYLYLSSFMGRAIGVPEPSANSTPMLVQMLNCAIGACVGFDLYNAEIYPLQHLAEGTFAPDNLLDITAPFADMGRIEPELLQNSQVYAFANLVFDGVTSYAAKEMPAAISASEETLKEVVTTAAPSAVPK